MFLNLYSPCAKTAVSEHLIKILTLPLDSATLISIIQIFWQMVSTYQHFWQYCHFMQNRAIQRSCRDLNIKNMGAVHHLGFDQN